MAWNWMGNMAFLEPIMIQYNDVYIGGLVQDSSISTALAMKILQSGTKLYVLPGLHFTYAIIYVMIHHIIFRFYLLIYLYFFKYSCTNIFL